jgi:hypothetical protein
MTQTFFLVYLGSLLASSIALFAFVKQFATGFAEGGKKPVIYGTFSSVLASAAAFATTFISNNLYIVFCAFTAMFILFGIIHIRLVHKKYFATEAGYNSKAFIGELLFGLSVVFFTILLFSSLQYFLVDKSFLFYPMMMSTLGFFIPLMFMHTFEAAYNIPAPIYNAWTYPAEPLHLPEEDSREKLLVIGFEIAKRATDTKRTYFRAKAPENIYLGDLYYFFMNDYNELQSETPIEYLDGQQGEHKWLFRLKTKWFQPDKMLNPSLSVKDNGIEENSVIICDRV